MKRKYYVSLAKCLLAALLLPSTAFATNLNFQVESLDYFSLGFRNKQTGATDYVLRVDQGLSTINLNLDTSGFLNVQGNLGGTLVTAGGQRVADFNGSLGLNYRAYQETDAGTGTTYWTSQHTDLGNDMLDEQAGGYIGLQLANINGLNATPTIGFGVDLKMANITSQNTAGEQAAYRELVNDGPFSFILGELQAYNGDTIFKTWLYAGQVEIGGVVYEVAGDIHSRVTPNSEVPEPATMLLLGAPLAGFLRRKRL